jgi:hypothetical protein
VKFFCLGLLVLASRVCASPFLVCDPYPFNANLSLNPTAFIITGLGANPIQTPATALSGGVYLHYDLAGLSFGNYTVTASAVNQFGGVSVPSAPFIFTLGAPAPPINLRIVP